MLKQIWKYKSIIFLALLLLAGTLYLNQCNQTKKAKAKYETAVQIANQNTAALGDKEIQLKVTKDQLALYDKNLYNALVKIDSLNKIKSKVITVTVPVYLGKDVTVPSTLLYDSILNKYGLKFTSIDQVRTINGISWFLLDNQKTKLVVVPDGTEVKGFKLNFAIAISEYTDAQTKFTKVKMVPFVVREDGSLGQEIPNSLLKLDFRNAEILDKPYVENPCPQSDGKRHLQTGWALTISPLAVGAFFNNGTVGYGFTPNIGISYYITLRK